jgi:DNA-directed RNA polymerase subunit L
LPRIVIKRREPSFIEVELPGEDHSLPNLIVGLALRKPGVEYASYSIDHPLIGSPRIVLRTAEGVDPLEVLRSVLEEARSLAREFSEKLREELELLKLFWSSI